MKLYETVFILDTAPEASDAEIQKVVDLISANKGEVLSVDHWGMKKMAYEIKGKAQGYYTCVYFKGDENLPAKLENFYQLNESYLRYLTVVSAHTPEEIAARAGKAEARPAAQIAREPRPAGKPAAAAAPRAGKPEEAPIEAEVAEEPAEKPEGVPPEAEKAEEAVEKAEETPVEPEITEEKREPQETKAPPAQISDEEPEETAPEEKEAEGSEEEKSSPPADK